MRRRHRSAWWVALGAVGAACLAVACATHYRPEHPVQLTTSAAGLSGMTIGPDGGLWAVPEEARTLLRLDPVTGAVRSFPIVGMPADLEAEALAWRPGPNGGELVIGTETDGPSRPSDDLVILDFDGQFAHVREMVRCPYGLWHLQGQHNRGIEGLCAVGRDLVVAAEITGEENGRRYAPLGRRDDDGRWNAHRVWLSSDTGKISGVECRLLDDGVAEVFAIERHFGVLRILRFVLPPLPDGAGSSTAPTSMDEVPALTPEVVLNLDRWAQSRDPSPNFEGITFLEDGRLALLSDNHYRGELSGPSELWFVALPE
ncbi:MAG: hypothetical protein CMN30_04660 [Sandaracinus sp.]|nr:hypothetical protein [Sandaracinus sp.]